MDSFEDMQTTLNECRHICNRLKKLKPNLRLLVLSFVRGMIEEPPASTPGDAGLGEGVE